MSIQSGVLAIITRIKQKVHRPIAFRSLRLRTILVLLIISVLSILAMDFFLPGYIQKELIQLRMEKMQNQALILKNHLLNENYFVTADSATVGAELDHISSLYDGRVELIDSNYRVVKDTFSLDEGKFCIDRNVLLCFRGQEIAELLNEEDQYVEIARVVRREELQEKRTEGVLLIVFSVQDIYSITDELRSVLQLVMLLIGIVALALSLLYANWIIAPLKDIENTVVDITRGEMHKRLPKPRYREMEKLTTAFNEMMNQIESLDQSRQEFVSNVSHELKTPITAVKVLADSLMTEQELPAEVYREFMEDIVTEIDRENQLIADLLELVRLDKKNAELHPVQTNINELIEAALNRLKPIAAAKNVELVFESFRPVYADIDSVKFNIVISNLVENAIKYNNEDGNVRVSLNADYKYFYLKVADNGIGIPQDCQDKVFERFYRVDKARARETGGSGLGLSITRNIVRMHHGEIRLYSKEGEGTTFTVRIPINYQESSVACL